MDNLHFKALEKLSREGIIRLHIPYVVMREFQTQQREIYSKDITKIKSGLSGLIRKRLDADILNKLKTLKNELDNESENILSGAEKQIMQWANDIKANLYPLCAAQSVAALESYFQGNPPLKLRRVRNDIPDSFIVQSIYKLYTENKEIHANEIHVIAGDGKVREAFSDDDIVTYESLSIFIEKDLIQDKLKDIDLLNNIKSITDSVEEYDCTESEISNVISNDVGEKIVWSTFYDELLPGVDKEATITEYNPVGYVEIDFSEIRYYGNGQFGIPFMLDIVVLADYYIQKAEYSGIHAGREHMPSVLDHNDRYFEVADEFKLNIHGLVSITIDRDNINIDNISDSIVDGSIEIAEITDIGLC